MPVTHPSVLAARTPEPCTVAIPSIPHGVPFRRAWSGVFSRARGRGPGTTVALRSGAIMRFVAPAGGLARLADVTAAENASDGFDLAGDGYVVSGCEALRNGRDGFALGGVRYRVEGNRALENRRYGFALSGRDAGIGGTSGNEA